MRLADLCTAHNLPVNRRALAAAALFHDAGYHLNETEYGFECKEDFSAAVLGMNAQKYGFTGLDTYTAQKAIIATNLAVTPETLEEKILIRADLANVAGDYKEAFLRKTLLLIEEAKRLKAERNESFDHGEFINGSLKVLCTYISKELTLGPFDTQDRQSVFKLAAIANIRRWARDCATELNLPFGRLLASIKSEIVMRLLSRRSPRSLE